MTNEDARDEYFGLANLLGVVFLQTSSLTDVTCPFCKSCDVGFMFGKLAITAEVSGEDLFDCERQPLTVVVCQRSHVFFLREKDLILGGVSGAAYLVRKRF
jgi:hypothetical protein